MIKGCKNEL
uniref:Uncharacterized protein n=1 Tax=Anguilla anguilla TaxID=7936 RepID=A0A0E9UG47_ANGAN